MKRYFVLIQEDAKKKTVMSESQLHEFAVPYVALMNEHRSIEEQINVTETDNLLEELNRFISFHVFEIENVAGRTMWWLINNQATGAFDGYPEETADLTSLSKEDVEWYFLNWVLEDEHFVTSLFEEYQYV